MLKRPNLWDNVETLLEENDSTREIKNVRPKPSERAKIVQSTLYLPRQVHRQLKEIAFAMDCKMHDLFIEGINHILSKKGYGTVDELAGTGLSKPVTLRD